MAEGFGRCTISLDCKMIEVGEDLKKLMKPPECVLVTVNGRSFNARMRVEGTDVEGTTVFFDDMRELTEEEEEETGSG